MLDYVSLKGYRLNIYVNLSKWTQDLYIYCAQILTKKTKYLIHDRHAENVEAQLCLTHSKYKMELNAKKESKMDIQAK